MVCNYSVRRTGHSAPIKKGRSPGRLHSRWQESYCGEERPWCDKEEEEESYY